eukprot:Awhi_evm1s9017
MIGLRVGNGKRRVLRSTSTRNPTQQQGQPVSTRTRARSHANQKQKQPLNLRTRIQRQKQQNQKKSPKSNTNEVHFKSQNQLILQKTEMAILKPTKESLLHGHNYDDLVQVVSRENASGNFIVSLKSGVLLRFRVPNENNITKTIAEPKIVILNKNVQQFDYGVFNNEQALRWLQQFGSIGDNSISNKNLQHSDVISMYASHTSSWSGKAVAILSPPKHGFVLVNMLGTSQVLVVPDNSWSNDKYVCLSSSRPTLVILKVQTTSTWENELCYSKYVGKAAYVLTESHGHHVKVLLKDTCNVIRWKNNCWRETLAEPKLVLIHDQFKYSRAPPPHMHDPGITIETENSIGWTSGYVITEPNDDGKVVVSQKDKTFLCDVDSWANVKILQESHQRKVILGWTLWRLTNVQRKLFRVATVLTEVNPQGEVLVQINHSGKIISWKNDAFESLSDF